MEHFLDSTVTQPFWDNSVEPRLGINPGDVVHFDCPEPTGQITPDWTVEDLNRYHPAPSQCRKYRYPGPRRWQQAVVARACPRRFVCLWGLS